MLELYLIRHGQDGDNAAGILNGHRDEPLTAIGIAQAQEVAAKIGSTGLTFEAIYTSPLQRARRTAEIVADSISGPEPEVLSALIERDFGIMTGQPHSRIMELCAPDILQAGPVTYFLSPQGAETFPQLVQRAGGLLDYMQSRHDDGNVLLATHGDFGKMLYAAYYELPWAEVLTLFHFGNSDLLELSPEVSQSETRLHVSPQYNP